jgi:aminomethyltransferase
VAFRTALFEEHERLHGQIVEFAGWNLPVQYTSIIDEHTAVRKRVGVFDVSHMGQVRIHGKGAEDLVRRVFTNDIKPAAPGKVLYTHMLDERGRIIDDILFARESADSFFIVPNAATTPAVVKWFENHNDKHATIDNLSDGMFCIAVQGPRAPETVQKLTKTDLKAMKKMWAVDGEVLGVPCKIQTTGYTGEAGFELIGPNAHAVKVYRAILEAGREFDIRPCGLGARDTLRLEKAYLLSGQDFHGDRTTLETQYDWVVKWDHEFVGKAALEAQKKAGTYERWVGLKATGRGIPRHDYPLYHDGEQVAKITSGTMSPTLRVGVAMAYVPPALTKVGTKFAFEMRGQKVDCEVVPTPFL